MIKHKSKKRGGKATVVASPREVIITAAEPIQKTKTMTETMTETIYNEHDLPINSEKHCFDIKLVNLFDSKRLILNNNFDDIGNEIVKTIKKINENSLGELKNIINSDDNKITVSESDTDASIQKKYEKLIQKYKDKLTKDTSEIQENLDLFKKNWTVQRTNGGGVLHHLYNATPPDLVAMEYIQYVNDINADIDLKIIDIILGASALVSAKKEIVDRGLLTGGDIRKYSSFFEFIFSNKDEAMPTKKLKIPAEEKFEITTLNQKGARLRKGNQGNILSYTYNAREYNEDIVIDFEKNLIEHQGDINSFMEEQNNFIESTLTPEERWTIRDYTSYSANPFYGAYKTSKLQHNENWFIEYKVKNSLGMLFDNAYLPQILKYIKDKPEFNVLETNINTNLSTLVNIVRYPGDQSLDERYSNLFTQNDWEIILNMFEEDVNNIIKKMPTPKKPIYCYRGVTHHYVTLDAWDARKEEYSLNCYYLSRITSLSLDFKKAKDFYNSLDDKKNENPNKHLYRAVIMPGCNMLFVPSLSAVPNEYEIILPTYSLVLDAKGWNNQITIPAVQNYDAYQGAFNTRALDRIKYNNRTNEYGVCGRKDDKLISSDIVIIGTFGEDNPKGRPAFDVDVDGDGDGDV
jgi:hypothetical protein